MSNRLDNMLRETLYDLAREARPRNLAGAAVTQGRRMRRRRTAAVALAVLVVTVGAALPLLRSPGVTEGPEPAGPTPTMSQALKLPDGFMIGAVTGRPGRHSNATSLIWNRATKQMVTVNYPVVIPSPSRNIAAVVDDDGIARYGLLDVGSGDVRWLDDIAQATAWSVPAWSPDGRYLAVLDFPKGGGFAVALVDSTDGSVRKLPLNWTQYYCADFCQVGWRDGATLSIPSGRNTSEGLAPTYLGVQFVSATDGSPAGAEVLPGSYAAPDDRSSDGRYITLVTGEGATGLTPRSVVYDTVEQRVVRPTVNPLDVWWVGDQFWLEAVDGSLHLVGVDHGTMASTPLPALSGANHVVLIYT